MPNVRVLNADALAGKNTLNPEVLDNVRAGLAVAPERRFKLVANLPYNVATPDRHQPAGPPRALPEPGWSSTIQLELAERMRAEPGTEAYGALSVLVQALADVEIVRTLPPQRLLAAPQGRFGRRRDRPRRPEKRAAIGDLPWFHSVVRQVFLHRRKNLRRVLHSLWRDRWTQARGRRPARNRSA